MTTTLSDSAPAVFSTTWTDPARVSESRGSADQQALARLRDDRRWWAHLDALTGMAPAGRAPAVTGR